MLEGGKGGRKEGKGREGGRLERAGRAVIKPVKEQVLLIGNVPSAGPSLDRLKPGMFLSLPPQCPAHPRGQDLWWVEGERCTGLWLHLPSGGSTEEM